MSDYNSAATPGIVNIKPFDFHMRWFSSVAVRRSAQLISGIGFSCDGGYALQSWKCVFVYISPLPRWSWARFSLVFVHKRELWSALTASDQIAKKWDYRKSDPTPLRVPIINIIGSFSGILLQPAPDNITYRLKQASTFSGFDDPHHLHFKTRFGVSFRTARHLLLRVV